MIIQKKYFAKNYIDIFFYIERSKQVRTPVTLLRSLSD